MSAGSSRTIPAGSSTYTLERTIAEIHGEMFERELGRGPADAPRSALPRRMGGGWHCRPPVGRHPGPQRGRPHRRHGARPLRGALRGRHPPRDSGRQRQQPRSHRGGPRALCAEVPALRYINNCPAERLRLRGARRADRVPGDAVAIVMADGSDSPADLVAYVRKMQDGYDCVFGSRFIRGGAAGRLSAAQADHEPAGQLLSSARCSGCRTTTSPTPSSCTGAR